MSALVAGFADDDRRVVEGLIRRLPEGVTVLHPRDAVPHAAVLSARHGLNLLAAEALATALVLEGRLVLRVKPDQAPSILE